jgi:hypothetical protein
MHHGFHTDLLPPPPIAPPKIQLEREREKTTKAWKTTRNPISKTKKRKLQQQTVCPCKNGVLWINRRN